MLRLPATHIRSLICFASGVHAILLASCFATCAPGRVGGDFRARAIVQPATQTAGTLARGRERDLPGSQTIHPVPLPRSATPAEPTIPRLFDGFVDAAPALPTARASALNEFRGSITRLWHLLPTLQDWCCHHPCKARFRLAGSPLPGGSRTLRIATKGFRSQSHPPFLDLSWRKGSFMAIRLLRHGLFRFNVGRPDHLAPLLGFLGDELGEVGGRQRKRCVAKLSDPQRHLGIGKREIDFLV